jgi:hypothetical protein
MWTRTTAGTLRTMPTLRATDAIALDMKTNMPSRTALQLAAESGADPRTCERALTEGAHVIRTRSVRDSIESAARKLKIELPPSSKERR